MFIACSSSVKQDNQPITYIFSPADRIDPQLYDIRNEFFKDAKRYGVHDLFYQKQFITFFTNFFFENRILLGFPEIV